MNQSLKDNFYSGELNRLCKVSISQGDPEFKHEMSRRVNRQVQN